MTTEGIVSHQTQGRLRIKISEAKGDAEYFAELKKTLAANPKISSVEVNPVTASVLILHNTGNEEILTYAGQQGLIKIAAPTKNSDNVSTKIAEVFKAVNNSAVTATGGGLDLPRISFLTLMGFGLYQLSRGNFVVPPWYTAFWYAHGMFTKYLAK
ncbi:HMA2 domain-containing protein [Candidatus Magnetominusculus dajiuhuensis]|uniref:HMA2 domain-containing protein n=1 Tax=Candidatus Magnetominusculus dajiuhuensis TaxID=3137712 RepID=UPI003B430846